MKKIALVFALVFTLVLSGCGGSSDDSSTSDTTIETPSTPTAGTETTVEDSDEVSGTTTSDGGVATTQTISKSTVSGVAIDDPIVNGTVVATDLNGVEIGRTTTDANGKFSLSLSDSAMANGYKLSISGGKLGTEDFTDVLNAVYSSTDDKSQANITLLTTLVDKLAESETGTLIEKRDKAIDKLVKSGMIEKDEWSVEKPKSFDLAELQNNVKSKGLTTWLRDMEQDLEDGELSASAQKIFTKASGGISAINITPTTSVSIFAGQKATLYIGVEFIDNIEKNVTIKKLSAPDWVTITNNKIDISPAITQTAYGSYTVSIEVIPEGETLGRTQNINISLLKAVELLSGTLGTAGGRIDNEWKDISITVDANKLTQDYDITYYAGINENGEMVLWFKTTPQMSSAEMAKLNLNQPSVDIIKDNYLSDVDVTRNLKVRTINRADGLYDGYAEKGVPQECRPALINGKINEMVWRDANGDGVAFPYVLEGNIAVFNYDYTDFSEEGLTGGLPRVQPGKVALGGLIRCASALRSGVPADDASIAGKEPVLFVHGFINSGLLGGYDLDGDAVGGEYFANFPALVKDYEIKGEKLMPFVFQWRTNAKFEDVASELGRAVKHLKRLTGKKVHIVAHSFGGLLTRTLVQGFASTKAYTKDFAENNIASVTTVGTPHSGTFGSSTTVNFDGQGDVVFPEGRNGLAGAGISTCGAITCFQTGSPTTLSEDLYGVESKPGHVVYELYKDIDNYPNVPTQILIGLVPASIDIEKQDNGLYTINYDFLDNTAIANPGAGDELISVFGQRVIPDSNQNNLEAVYNQNNIEEHILHMDATYKDVDMFNRSKDDNLFSIYSTNGIDSWDKNPYAIDIQPRDVKNYMFGYNHRTGQFDTEYYAKDIYDKEIVVSKYTTMNSEVGLHNCKEASTCGHPTWSYFKTFLQDKVEIQDIPIEDQTVYVSGKVLEDGTIPKKPYTVKVYVNNTYLHEETISGSSDYNISVEFFAKTGSEVYEYYVKVIPDASTTLRTTVSNRVESDVSVEETNLSLNDVVLVDSNYVASQISVNVKDAIDGVALSDFNVSVYKGDNLIISGYTSGSEYNVTVGVGDYTCVANKVGYKENIPVGCYSVENKTNAYTIDLYRDEAIGTASRILVLADDIQPWDTTAFTDIMAANGYTNGTKNNQYFVVPSNQISVTDMVVGKDLVIIMNDQNQNFYNNLAVNMDKIDTFVKNGGVLLFEVSDRGWNSGQMSTAGITSLPGGVTFNYNFDSKNINVNKDSTLMTGVADVVEGNYASHESFSNLVEGTTVYTTDQNGVATLIEYKYGLGWVIATGQPLEHGYANGNTMGVIYPKLYNYVLGNVSDVQRNITRRIKIPRVNYPSHY